nr:LytTR family DNA-binding domain-containing protein [Chryseolinea lacunae]
MFKILQESFPYYLDSDRKNMALSAGLGAFMVVFLVAFNPLEWEHFVLFLIIGLVIFVTLYVTIVWFPKVWPNVFDSLRWTVGKYILFTLWQLLIIGIVAPVLLEALGFYRGLPMTDILWYFFVNMMLYGSISIVIFTFVLRTVMLKNSLQNALHANAELARIRTLKHHPTEVAEPHTTITIQSDTSDSVELHLPDLLYIESSNYYSTLFWNDGQGVQKKMLRVNLKTIEGQLNNTFIIRCHRSYMVNINAITEVGGNTNGYKLTIRDSDITVPVSRSKGREVIEKIEQIRNLAESA